MTKRFCKVKWGFEMVTFVHQQQQQYLTIYKTLNCDSLRKKNQKSKLKSKTLILKIAATQRKQNFAELFSTKICFELKIHFSFF